MRVMRSGICLVVSLLALAVAAGIDLAAQTAPVSNEMGWLPNHPATQAEDYAGAAACASCHPAQSKKQAVSEMGLSITRPVDARVLAEHPVMSFERGKYTYTLRKVGGQVTFTASDGHDTIAEPVYVVVGSGSVFQAYLIQHKGEFHRAPVDFFTAQGKLGPDPEADAAMPATLEGALGRHLSANDVRGCFGCHSPATVIGDKFDVTGRTPGIGCEVCHGPGAKHAAAMRGGKKEDAAIFNPAHLPPAVQSDFCDQCHESAAKMKAENPHGVRSVVSPAYRLQSSRCFLASDLRSSCAACHDPHAPMERKTAAYDDKCLACHTVRGAAAKLDHTGKACPKATSDCAGCHMPKVPVPNSPMLFTDHRIRIAAAGAPFPE
jgi:hypothetical protein